MQRLAGIYVRISADPEGKKAGVTRQEKECRELAERLGWVVTAVFSDNDVSASNRRRKRKAWLALLESLRQGEINAVIGWHTDRFYRQLRDLEDLIDLIENRDVAIETVTAGIVDLKTASGRMGARIGAVMNRHESERMGERQKGSYRDPNRKMGGHRRAFGYTIDWKVNRKEAALLKQAVKRIIAGESCYRICADWNAQGVATPYGSKWRPSKMVRMFTGGHLAGNARGRPAILSDDEHRLILAALGDRPKGQMGRPSGRRYALIGLLVCGECGDKLTGRSGQYLCPSGHMSITATYAERHLAGIATLRVWNEEANGKAAKPKTQASKVEQAALKELRKLEARYLEVEKAIADGELSARSGGRVVADLDKRRDQLQAKIKGGIQRKVQRPKTFKQMLKTSTDFEKRWKERKLADAEVMEMQDLLRATFKHVTVHPATRPSKKGFDPSRFKPVMQR